MKILRKEVIVSRNEVVRKGNKGRTIVTCAGGAHDGGEEGVGEHRAPVHHQLEVLEDNFL